VGEAQGHGVWVDETFVRQVVAAANALPLGVKARWGHPGPTHDPVGTELGRFSRFRAVYLPAESQRVGHAVWAAVADLLLMPTAATQTACLHLTQMATADPGLLGASLEFLPAAPAPPASPAASGNRRGLPHERLGTLLAVAITSDPACNPHGLLLP
jgi:hypothetical protein